MSLYLYVYKCSCKQCYVVLFKIKHELYIAPGSAPPPPRQRKIVGAHMPSCEVDNHPTIR
jgi:hypothetical protein